MALMFTGLSRESARFQARSAFSGVGFTTKEAESIVNHPVRRQIVMLLMLMGNIGVATVIATVMVSISSTVGASLGRQFLIAGILAGGSAALWFFFSSRWVERRMNRIIAWALKRFTTLDVRDYIALLQVDDGYSVSEMSVELKHWIAGRSLLDLRLSDEGILVLGIRRQGTYRGIPGAIDTIEAGDTLILYGELESVRQLDLRRGGSNGDKQRNEAVERREKKVVEEETATESVTELVQSAAEKEEKSLV